jgi:hypothetical protein
MRFDTVIFPAQEALSADARLSNLDLHRCFQAKSPICGTSVISVQVVPPLVVSKTEEPAGGPGVPPAAKHVEVDGHEMACKGHSEPGPSTPPTPELVPCQVWPPFVVE